VYRIDGSVLTRSHCSLSEVGNLSLKRINEGVEYDIGLVYCCNLDGM
jgi:hypothetical protein